MKRDVGVIIVAAGSGSRTGSQELKQFRWVAGKPMLLHSIQTFQARTDVAMVVCVLPREYVGDPPPWIFQSDSDRLLLSVGGRHRGESVSNGLEDLPSSVEHTSELQSHVNLVCRLLLEKKNIETLLKQNIENNLKLTLHPTP